MSLTPSGYTLLGLTALVAFLVAVLVFAVLRFSAAARDTRRPCAEAARRRRCSPPRCRRR